MTLVGIIINPSSGRDIRRLTGGASISDNYAKRRVASCVLDGIDAYATPTDPIDVRFLPDIAGLGANVATDAPSSLSASLFDVTVDGTGMDTRRAAAICRDEADVVIALGGDGTQLDVAHEIGDVPVLGISTGTNNVVPTTIDGTAAGVAAALVANGDVSVDAATYRHGMIEATVESDSRDDTSLFGLGAVGVIDQQFIGASAISTASDFLGGMVSRASPADSGLTGITGTVETLDPTDAGGIAIRIDDPTNCDRTVTAITAPGIVEDVGIERCRHVAVNDDPETFDVTNAVVSHDGERRLEVTDAHISLEPIDSGPRLIEPEWVFAEASERELFTHSS